MDPNCPTKLRQDMTGWLRYWSSEGASWATEDLLLRPCEIWPHVRGNTVFFIGDSMIQVADCVPSHRSTRKHWEEWWKTRYPLCQLPPDPIELLTLDIVRDQHSALGWNAGYSAFHVPCHVRLSG